MILKPQNILRLETDIRTMVGEWEDHEEQKSHGIMCLLASNLPRNGRTPLHKLFNDDYETDLFPTEILTCFQNGTQHHRKITLGECGEENGRLTYRNCLSIPEYEPL